MKHRHIEQYENFLNSVLYISVCKLTSKQLSRDPVVYKSSLKQSTILYNSLLLFSMCTSHLARFSSTNQEFALNSRNFMWKVVTSEHIIIVSMGIVRVLSGPKFLFIPTKYHVKN